MVLHSRQQGSEGSNPSTSSLLNTHYICLFDYGHPGGCEVVSHCGFDLCFPNNQ